MNPVDSSAWLEYFVANPGAAEFAPAIEDRRSLLVPTVVMHELFQAVIRQRSEDEALRAYAVMAQRHVVSLSAEVALDAARLSLDLHLPMADSLILATARSADATLWTQDSHFDGLSGVRYIAKARR